MKNRLTLVTGGTRGIGAAICIALKNAGYRVIANYYENNQSAEEFSKKHQIPIYCWDVGDAKSCQENIQAITNDHGPIEILIHNAGITRDRFMHKMSVDMWDDVIRTNLNSCFYVAQSIIASMRNNNFGRVVMISSVNAVKGQMGQTNYSASKAGMIGFVKSLALENASKGITVNAIAPGYIETDMVTALSSDTINNIAQQIPVGHLGSVDDIARAVLFLIHDDSCFITGSTLHINGGYHMG
jgi:acetoacetyl-CoA reductase